MDSAKQIKDLNKVYMEAVYGGAKKVEKKDTRLVVTAADKKANTKAYQNYKAGNKAYKAADHLGEGKKADKDYDGDGKIESGTDEYMGSKDKAIKKALGKEVKDLQKAAETGKGKYVAKADKVKGVGESRWWDVSKEDMIEGYGKGVKMADLPKGSKVGSKKVAAPKGSKMKKGHDCASKVKHEEYGFGDCIKEMHTLDEEGNVTHYDVMFESTIIKNIPVSDLHIIEGMYHEHAINHEKNMELQEKQKDTPDQVAAVIDMYRSKKGTGEAVKDTEKGDKKAAKKERDYAACEREKMKKDDPNWKHKKGSTTESVDADYIEIVREIKSAETQADIKRWGALKESGNFTDEELDTIVEADIADILARLEKKRISKGGDPEESPLPAMRKYHANKKKVKEEVEIELDEAERDLGDRLHRKRKLYDKTTKKAMQFARDEGEASGHARYRMGSIDREMDGIKAKMKEKEKK